MTATKKSTVPDNLRMYIQHGAKIIEVGTTEAQLTCPLCQHDKFYVQIEKQLFHCKHCNTSGNKIQFLYYISEANKKNFFGNIAIALSKKRNLKTFSLRKHEVGYNPLTKKYTIPILDKNGKYVVNIYNYKFSNSDKKGLISTKGFSLPLYNRHTIQTLNVDEEKPIFLVEGVWDKITLTEILKKLKIEAYVVSILGAGNFSDNYIDLFRGKNVIALMDNDDAGKQGANKIFDKINIITKSTKFIHWNLNKKIGFDISDLYLENKLDASLTYNQIMNSLKDIPVEIEGKKQNTFSQDVAEPDEIYSTYKKWLKLDDTTIIDVIYGTIFANRIPGLPVWLFLVGPAGCGKSEFIMSIYNHYTIKKVTQLTPAGLICGLDSKTGTDPSLIPQLKDKILAIKDFTTLLKTNPLVFDEVMGILRDSFDGDTARKVGLAYRNYSNVNFGIIAGVTHFIEQVAENLTEVGERFISYHVPYSQKYEDLMALLQKAAQNVQYAAQKKEELSNLGQKALNYKIGRVPELPEEIEFKIYNLACITSLMRTMVPRDKYTRNIIHEPKFEIPTRLVQQYTKFALGNAAFHRQEVVTNYQYEIIKKICFSTIPPRNFRIIQGALKNNNSMTIDKFKEGSALSEQVLQEIFHNLIVLKIFNKTTKIGGYSSVYKLTDYVMKFINASEMCNNGFMERI